MKIIFEKVFRFNARMVLKNYARLILKKFRKTKLWRVGFFLKPHNSRFLIPIIIFQPGKVGSLSVFHSLVKTYLSLGITTPIHHVHILNKFDFRERIIEKTRKNAENDLAHIQEWRELREQIDSEPEQVWNIVNLVRDPVAIKISSMFQALDNFIPDWEERYQHGRLTMSDLDELLNNKIKLQFGGLDLWYDEQIKAIWGFDVFSMDFPKEKGYAIYSQGNVNLLIIRLENLNQVAKEAFHEFLGLKNFTLSSRNVGDKKAYAKLYREFKARPLPEKTIEDAYSTRYAKHFYSTHEIEEFKKFWLKQ